MYRVAGHRWMTSTGRWYVNTANLNAPRQQSWVSMYLPLNSWWYPDAPAYNYWFQVLDGSASFVGDVTKKTSKSLDGSLTAAKLIGGIVKKTARAFSAAPLPFTGGLTKKTGKTLAGSLSFTGDLTKSTKKILTGSLNFAGSLLWRLLRGVFAGLTFVGTLTTVFIPVSGAGKKKGKRRFLLADLFPEHVNQWLM